MNKFALAALMVATTVSVWSAPGPSPSTAPGAPTRPTAPAPPPGPNGAIAVFIDGAKVKFDVAPVMQNGAVFVPLRGVFEKMKATVDYNQKTNTVIADRDGVRIEVRVGDRFAKVNGENVVMMVPAGMLQRRVFVPLRFLSEQLGYDVDWNPAKAVVAIKSK